MSARKPRVEFWQARDGWRWRIKAANNRIIAESGEAYTTLDSLRRAYGTVEAVVFEMVPASPEVIR